MRFVVSLDGRVVRLAALTLAIGVCVTTNAVPAAQGRGLSDQESVRQWKEVRAKYPLVAMAYLQAVEALADNRSGELSAAAGAAFQSALRLGAVAKVPVVTVCAPCKLAVNNDDVERYLGCLDKRISCLKP